MYRLLKKRLNRILTVLTLITAFAVCGSVGNAVAGSAQWQSSNIQYLYGNNFKLGDKTRSTITFEHANGWKYGDNFFFVDIGNADRSGNTTQTNLYAEFSPRLSLGKITGKDLSFGFVKDILLAGTLEAGEGFHNQLYGVGFSLDLPKFAFFELNIYVRDNLNQDGTTYQITPVWALPFSVGKVKLLFEGFVDYAGKEGTAVANFDAQPRLLVDVGNFWGAPDSLYAGTEYIHWHNKFGVDGVDERVFQGMLKWVF
ncbi:MAG: DUF5020 domain-containing protein [Deltaproteobacteria bacterium]|nr:DUF5020 domain-containing protein [Deltaproteobacteria bacterium]